jgi:hypothetical protein
MHAWTEKNNFNIFNEISKPSYEISVKHEDLIYIMLVIEHSVVSGLTSLSAHEHLTHNIQFVHCCKFLKILLLFLFQHMLHR